MIHPLPEVQCGLSQSSCSELPAKYAYAFEVRCSAYHDTLKG